MIRQLAELDQGSAPKQVIDVLPTNSSNFSRITGCHIPKGTLFVGGDQSFRQSLGFSGDLSSDVAESVIRDRLEFATLSETFQDLQARASEAMYQDDPSTLDEWRHWTVLDMQEASRTEEEGFIVWVKPAAKTIPIPQKNYPPAPVVDGETVVWPKKGEHPSVRTTKAAARTLDLLKSKRVERCGDFTPDCFKSGKLSAVYTEELGFCEFLTAAGSNKEGIIAYRSRKFVFAFIS